MKTLFTIALALSLVTSGFANEGTMNVKAASHVKVSEKSIVVSLDESLGKVRLAIEDEKGKRLHTQTLFLKSSTRVPFDLSNLPAGNYTVEVASLEKKNTVGKAVYKVVTKEADQPIALPLMASGKVLASNKVKLTVFGLEEPGIDVKIKNQFGRTLFEERINENEGFQKVYHLNDINPKSIVMEVTDIKGRQKNLYF